MPHNLSFLLFFLNPVHSWLLRLTEAEDGSTSSETFLMGEVAQPISDQTRCVQLTLPDHSDAPKNFGSCSSWWDWSNCTADFNAQSASSSHCSTDLSTVTCRRKNGFFHVCARKSCPDPVPGVWATWGSWNSCNTTCGSGQETRNRTCNVQPGGKPCPSDDHWEQSRSCTMDCKAGAFNVTNLDIGEWHNWEYCPNTFQVSAFNIKTTPSEGVTGIQLVCDNPEKSVITSHAMDHGEFPTEFFTCSEGYTMVRVSWQPEGGDFVDDRGLTCFELYCPSSGQWHSPSCYHENDWRTISCSIGSAVCGIITKAYYHWSDHAGITNAQIQCCHLPPPSLI